MPLSIVSLWHFMPFGAAIRRVLTAPLHSYMQTISNALLCSFRCTVYGFGVKEAFPFKCVLLSTSKTARKRMTAWRIDSAAGYGAVKLDFAPWESSGSDSVSFGWYFE